MTRRSHPRPLGKRARGRGARRSWRAVLLDRRLFPLWFSGVLAVALLGYYLWHLLDEATVQMIVRVAPGHPECERWANEMRAAGYRVWVKVDPDLKATRSTLHVPEQLASDHTTVTMRNGRYVIEGHVPADAITRLFRERPAIRGLAVPGKPAGAPGLEQVNPVPYDVWAFSSDGRIVSFAHYDPSPATPLP